MIVNIYINGQKVTRQDIKNFVIKNEAITKTVLGAISRNNELYEKQQQIAV
jgi:hypothetical protein